MTIQSPPRPPDYMPPAIAHSREMHRHEHEMIMKRLRRALRKAHHP